MSSWQPCGRRLRECIDDVCRSMDACAWPPDEDARAAGHAREGAGGADSVSSEVTASARPDAMDQAAAVVGRAASRTEGKGSLQ